MSHQFVFRTYETACGSVAREFTRMIRERDARAWRDWLNSAKATALCHFAASFCYGEAAIPVALQLPWNNGQVEGQVHRLKLIKRQMYGRAKVDLLWLLVQTLNHFNVKVDCDLGRKRRLFARESYAKRDLVDPIIYNRFLYTGGMDSNFRNHTATINHVLQFTPTLLNEFRASFSRFNNVHFGNDYPVAESNNLGIGYGNLPAHPETLVIASFWVGSLSGTGSDGSTGLRLTKVYQIVDD